MYVTNERSNAETHYRARFYFDPNSIVMAKGNAHYIFVGYNAAGNTIFQIEFRFSSSVYQIRVGVMNDGTSVKNTAWFNISDAPHPIEMDWWAASGAGTNNGGLTLWIDGVQKATLSAIDKDTRQIDSVRLGAVSGIDTGTRGTYYFDAFESHRLLYIGP